MNKLPLYEYQCKNCGRIIEVKHGVNEIISNIFCPSCNKLINVNETEKLIGLSSFKLNWPHFHTAQKPS